MVGPGKVRVQHSAYVYKRKRCIRWFGSLHVPSDLDGVMFGCDVIEDKELRDLWYNSQVPRGRKGHYAYGLRALRCFRTEGGYRIGNVLLPKDTPVYDYGFDWSTKFKCPQGAFVYRCQIPGVELLTDSVETRLFRYGDQFLARTRNRRLKVRCGKYYRVVMLCNDVTEPYCYIFGTNIRVPSQRVPKWMRRRHIVYPNPMKTSRREIRTPDGRVFRMGRARLGPVEVAGIRMQCVSVRQLCVVKYNGERYYVHPSVML